MSSLLALISLETPRLKLTDVIQVKSGLINPNWHEAGQIHPPYNFWIEFCQLNFYQKFPNIFGG